MEIMDFMLYMFPLLVCLGGFSGVQSGSNCPEDPVITPSHLVVKHGDTAEAVCSVSTPVCDTCNIKIFNWEASDGHSKTLNETHVKWEANVTNWVTRPRCYFITSDDQQCFTRLNIVLYKPPDSVSLSYKDHSGPLLEGNMYSLQCDVQNVAPVEKLTVTFYRGDTAISSPEVITDKEKTPLNRTFTHNITASKEDNGVVFWCEAKLDLGPEGPLPPPLVRSDKISATIYYKPYREQTQYDIRISDGDHTNLTCLAEGNPRVNYTWLIPNISPRIKTHEDVLSISSATFDDEGQYTCVASNSEGDITVTFDVVVEKPPSVSLSYKDHSGPLLEGNMYCLQCDVQIGAPVEKLTVTFFKGDTAISSPEVITDKEKTPLNRTFTQNIIANKEDDGELYWCEAKLDLGPEGPLVVRSETISATIYYKPHKEQTQYQIWITEGDHTDLTCLAEGNPRPNYTWTFPQQRPAVVFHESVLSISSATFDDEGQYTCVASNSEGDITVTFDVDVKRDILPLVAGLAAVVVVVVIAIASFVYSSYYRHTRIGHYKLKDVIHFRNSNHVAQPNGA